MSFASLPFSERIKVMGEPAETAFRIWAEEKGIIVERYGLEKPKFKRVRNLPPKVRGTPDFLCEGSSHFYTECKGMGGRVLKMKLESMEILEAWHQDLPVWIFIYDSTNERTAFINFREMEKLCYEVPIKKFPNEEKQYYELPARLFTWEKLERKHYVGY